MSVIKIFPLALFPINIATVQPQRPALQYVTRRNDFIDRANLTFWLSPCSDVLLLFLRVMLGIKIILVVLCDPSCSSRLILLVPDIFIQL